MTLLDQMKKSAGTITIMIGIAGIVMGGILVSKAENKEDISKGLLLGFGGLVTGITGAALNRRQKRKKEADAAAYHSGGPEWSNNPQHMFLQETSHSPARVVPLHSSARGRLGNFTLNEDTLPAQRAEEETTEEAAAEILILGEIVLGNETGTPPATPENTENRAAHPFGGGTAGGAGAFGSWGNNSNPLPVATNDPDGDNIPYTETTAKEEAAPVTEETETEAEPEKEAEEPNDNGSDNDDAGDSNDDDNNYRPLYRNEIGHSGLMFRSKRTGLHLRF